MAVEVCSPTRESEDTSSAPQPRRFLARQPILNIRREVLGYELLFRTGWENCFSGEIEDATRKTLDNFLFMDMEAFTDNKLAFVNCTRQALVERLVTLLSPATTVLEILETVQPDAELLQACRELKKMGYRFALDDFVPRPELMCLLDVADFVKVDFRISNSASRKHICALARAAGAHLIAEKVEDQHEFDQAHAEGFEFFQGYFFCRPKIVANREIPPNRMNYLRLLIELTRNPLNVREVTRIVRLEPSLCYRLLRLANSALWGTTGDITSVKSALMLVGEDRFRVLVSVAASCVLAEGQPAALISLSLERARFCELLAPLVGESPTEQFMLGLLSLLDAMLDTPMETIAKSLPLREQAAAALLGAVNPAAVPLCLIRSFEQGAWGSCSAASEKVAVSEEALARLYLEAVKWASDTLASSR